MCIALACLPAPIAICRALTHLIVNSYGGFGETCSAGSDSTLDRRVRLLCCSCMWCCCDEPSLLVSIECFSVWGLPLCLTIWAA